MRIAKWLLFLSTTFLCLFHLSGCGQSSSPSKSLAQHLTAPPVEITTIPVRDDKVGSLQFSPDGKLLALGFNSPFRVELWTTNDWKKQNVKRLDELQFGLETALAFSPAAPHSLAFLNDSGVFMGDISDAKMNPHPLLKIPVLKGRVFGLALKWSPDGQLLARAVNRHVSITRTNDRLPGAAITIPDTISTLAFTPDGSALVVSCDDATVSLFDVKSGKILHALQKNQPDSPGIGTPLDVSRDGLIAAPAPLSITYEELSNDKDRAAAMSRIARKDQPIHLWDAKTGKFQRSLKGHSVTWALAFSPDGSVLATGSNDRSLRFWNVQTGKEITAIKPDPNQPDEGVIRDIAFSPDGNTVTTLTSDSVVKVWKITER